MRKLLIEDLEDSYECESCGSNWSQGYRVHLGDEVILEMEPVAHCFEGQSYTEEDLLERLLPALGFKVERRFVG